MRMAVAPHTISIALVRGMLDGARLRGQSTDTWLAQAGISPDLLAQDEARVTAQQYIDLFQLLIKGLNDEALGFLTRPLKPGSLMLIARSALGAPDLEVALRRICHVLHLLQDDIEPTLEQDGVLAGIAFRMSAAQKRPTFLHEFLLRVVWRLAAWLAGGTLKIARFDFAFAQPAYVHSYGKSFPAPLQFGQPMSAFWFDARRLSRPIARDDEGLREFVASWPASAIVPRRDVEGMVARVRMSLMAARPTWPGLDAIAATLNISGSTLQRRLAIEGASFQVVKDDLRRDLAIACLGRGQTTVSELASELGFSEGASFQRAFKSWTGSSPGMYRRQLAMNGMPTPRKRSATIP